MKLTLLDAETLGSDLNFHLFKEFGQVVVYENTAPDKVPEHIADSDIIVINKIKINQSNLKNAGRLKLICIAATGFDNVDLAYCKERGIGVCNVVGYSAHSVAQVTLAMALSLYTRLTEYSSFVSSGMYTKSGVANKLTPVYHELYGKVWGVIGLGSIGMQVARAARSLGCSVIGFKRTPCRDVPCCDLPHLCQTADILSVHLPLSQETRGIISRELIATMKESAIFINVSRGAVADEAALADAIKAEKLAGLGIDVYSTEPFPQTHPFYSLLGLPNVCLTPHMAWGAFESRERCLREIIVNIRAFISGEARNRLV